MSTPTTTYADGFGVWHCEIRLGGVFTQFGEELATKMAREAITREIKERNQNDVLTGLTLVQRVSQFGSIVYYFKESSDE
jgi:hypothetical protein